MGRGPVGEVEGVLISVLVGVRELEGEVEACARRSMNSRRFSSSEISRAKVVSKTRLRVKGVVSEGSVVPKTFIGRV